MSRNATSSWSGYAHQGKIGFLVALRKINALLGSNELLDGHSVTFESTEDVAVIQGNTILEVHQVKAFMSADTIGSYTGALTVFEGCPGLNFLHTIVEIRNWGDLTAAQNPASVVRYPYTITKNFCGLDEVTDIVDSEIWSLLNSIDHAQKNNESWRINVFQEFLAALDEKIRYEHFHHNAATYNIRFTLEEVNAIVIQPPVKLSSKIVSIRKRLFDQFVLFIEQLDINELLLSEPHERKVTAAIQQIYSLDDRNFIKFLYNINPHKTDNERFETCEATDSFFESVSFYSTFLMTLIAVTGVEHSLDASSIPKYFKSQSYLLSSISGTAMMKKLFAKRILDNEHVNFSAYENDFIITENYDGLLGDVAAKLIPVNINKFTSKKNMSFISREDAVQILNLP